MLIGTGQLMKQLDKHSGWPPRPVLHDDENTFTALTGGWRKARPYLFIKWSGPERMKERRENVCEKEIQAIDSYTWSIFSFVSI